MKAPPLSYVRAATLSEAFQLWRDAGPDARLLAGGQSLLATLAFRLSDPGTLVDIVRLHELRGISQVGGTTIRVGALATHAELGRHDLIRRHLPLIAEAVPLIAHAAVRNRGTIGGSLAFADPAAELPACCVALDAMIVARNAADERRIPAAQFFTGLYATALRPYELIAAVEFPIAKPGERTAVLELARRSGDYAMAGVAAKTRLAGATLIEPQLVFFGVGDRPVVAERAMATISGQQALPATIAAAQAALAADLDPPADRHGSGRTKRHFARVLLARALARLAGLDEARAA
ncbi:MAG: FAD binding domain-containing protein [Hyphomicrobiaceae bacterium]|nr:FAD binding domain-containing protein [Hyphomicrobiaceae bacterium]